MSAEVAVAKISETRDQARWAVAIGTKKYTVTTYPRSSLLFVENSNGREVALGEAKKAAIRAAINKVVA